MRKDKAWKNYWALKGVFKGDMSCKANGIVRVFFYQFSDVSIVGVTSRCGNLREL